MAAIDESKLYRMFSHIAMSGAIIKSQQRGEDELPTEKKILALQELYEKNKATFVYRFLKHLREEDIELFKIQEDNYELKFYINKLKEALNPVAEERKIKNRRNNFMRTVLKTNGYFDDEELQNRDPLLYKQYIGQYKTVEEHAKKDDENISRKTLSQYLFNKMDHDFLEFQCTVESELMKQQQEEEEFDEDDEDDSDVDDEFKRYLEGKVPITDEEKGILRDEFICLMEKRFIDGDDRFDYTKVDQDENYDNIRDQDLEDKYFDED